MGTKDSSFSWPAFSENKCTNTVYPPAAYWGRSQTLTRTATRTGSAVHNWRQKIARHEDATSAMDAVYDTLAYRYVWMKSFMKRKTSPFEELTQEIRGAVAVNNGRLDRRVKAPSADISSVENGASAKFYKKLRSLDQEWSAPTFLGELRETARMLRKPAAALYNSADSLVKALRKRKGSGLNGGEVAKAASGLWLEYAFGWVPLISDSEAAAKAWARLKEKNDEKVHHVQSSFTKEFDRTKDLSSSYDKFHLPQSYCGTSYCYTRTDARWEERATIRYKAAVLRKLEMTTWDKWAVFGFQPSEFIPTAWELLPWSFLVDYFVNVDDILNSATTSTRDVVYIVKTTRRISRYMGRIIIAPEYLNQQWGSQYYCAMEGSPSSFSLVRKTISRRRVDSVPLPSLEFNLGQSINHVANMFSLFSQVDALYPQRFKFPAKYR